MARTAAAKKVAKAASAGGAGKGFQARRNLLFPAAMLLVVALGVVLILFARSERAANAPAGPPRLGDHWHSLYAIYDCDDFIVDFYPNDVDDVTGIHTHGDGLIHIHPFVTTVTGQFATIGAFMREIEVQFDDSTIELPDGSILDESGEGCASPDPSSDDPAIAEPGAELRVLRWETLQAEKALAFTDNLADVRFLGDGQIFVFAYVHPSVDNADVPRPSDTFLRSYLNLPPEDQPLIDDVQLEEGPVLGGPDESEPAPDDLPVTSEPAEPPTEGPTEPTEPPTEPTEPPTEGPTEPTEPPTEGPTEPTEPPTEGPAEPPAEGEPGSGDETDTGA